MSQPRLRTQAVRLDVQDAEVHALLAAAMAGQDKPAAAIDEYEVAIRLDSGQADCYAALARLQIDLGPKDDARLVIGRLRESRPIILHSLSLKKAFRRER